MRKLAADAVRSVVLASIVAGGLSMPLAAQACSCMQRDAARIFEVAERLVVARVTRVQYQRAWIGEARVWGDIQVVETLKAPAGPPLTKVWTEQEISTCSLPLVVGRVYLFAPWGDEADHVDHCSGWVIDAGDVEGERLLRQMRLIIDEQHRRTAISSSRTPPAASAARR